MSKIVREILSGSGLLCLLPICLSANPTGGAVVAGSASIAGQGTSAVTINQASNIAIINWQSFSINSGESTSFLQPGATSAALNRVLGGQTSLINGTLSANGQVYLVNGNGIIVGPGGVITAGGFTASTRDITNADFLSGNLHFTGSSAAGVQNLGTITALGGNVALIGRTVDNEGTITAPNGTAGLVAADDVLLAQDNADGSTITVSPTATPGAGAPVGVKNGGAIAAAAAELKAANGNIYGLAVQNLGTIRATTLSHQGGHIWLTSDTGKVSNAGKLDASATAAGGKGGSVTLKSTSGSVSHTGQIVAKGGTGGTGGQSEISGAQVQFTGSVDLSAPSGTRGNLLLDPTDVDVVTGGGTDITASTVDPSAVVAALLGANVTLSATTSITVDNEIDASGNASPGNLTLDAPTLTLNAPVVLNGSLNGTASAVNVSPSGLIQNGVDSIAATGGTISLAPGALYALTQEVLINKNVQFQGNGATLSGQGSTRDMEIDGGTVGLDELVFTGGNGNSSIGNGTLFNYTGGALLVYGQGAVSSVSITNSTFVGNTANQGGAIGSIIISGGSNTISTNNCTFTGNSAINGSVLYNDAAFGPTTSVSFIADTIVANSGTGAIYNTVDSGGTAVVSFSSTILAGNTNFSGESDYVSGGGDTLTDNGYNLYGENGNAGGFVPAQGTDLLLGADISTVVAPLSLYGGQTPTMALVQDSPALETGNPTLNESPDQRGIVRGDSSNFTGSNADIGAFEAQFVEVQADPVSTVYGNVPIFTYSVTAGPAGAAATLIGTPALLSPATNAGFYGEDIGQGTVVASPMYLVDFTAGDLTITQRPVTVEPDPGQGKIYGTTDPVLTYTTDPADAFTGLVNGDTLTGAPDYAGSGQFTGVGAYATTLGTIADSTGNYAISLTTTPPPFVISPRAVLVDVDPGSKTYGSTDPVLTYTPETPDATTGLVNGDTLSGAADYLGSGQFTSVGSYPTAPGTLNNPNYVVFPGAPSSFSITPRPVVVDPDPGQTKIYGTLDPALTYSALGLVNGDTLTGSPDYTGSGQFANVGSYPTNAGTLANPNYIVSLSGSAPTFAITPRAVVVDPDMGQGKIYGTTDPALTYTTDPADTTTGLLNGDTLTGAPDYAGSGQFTGVGAYGTTLGTIADSTGNYAITLTSTPPPFTISPRPVLIDIDPGQTKIYGTNDPTLTYTTEAAGASTGLVNGDTLTGAPDYVGSGPFANVGSYPTTPGTLASPNYVAIPNMPSFFTVTPRSVTVLPDSGQTKIYGTPDPALTYTTSPPDATSGLVGEDVLNGSPNYDGTGPFSAVGSYTTNLGNLSNSNYSISLSAVAPTFSITPRSVFINPDPGQSKVYGAADPTLTYTTSTADATTGLVNGDTLSGSPGYSGRGSNLPVGSYPTNVGNLANPNYNVAASSAPPFAITPATLYYVADAVTVPLNPTMFPPFTGTVSGFVAGDTQASATSGTLVFNTTATLNSTTGYYPINGSGLMAANYTFMQAAVNSVALTVGMPVTPQMQVAMQASTPNTPVSQSAAQTTSTTTTQDPTQSLPGGTSTPLVPVNSAPTTVDINVTAINANQTIDSTPISGLGDSPLGNPGGGQDSSSTSGIDATPVAQASSFSPDVGATPVRGGETVTVGGHAGTPPPPVVAAQLNTVLGDQAQSTLTGALADAGSTPTPAATDTTTAGSPAASSSAAVGAVAAAAAVSKTSAPAPLPPGGVMVAPGQTVSIAKGKAGIPTIPPPVFIQAQIEGGFSPETRSSLSDAAGISH